MAHAPTATEAALWRCLSGSQLGVRFVRQAVVGDFIVDFLARKASLVVEVGGDSLHAARRIQDARRDAKLRRAGYRLLRIPASLVERDLAQAVAMVVAALHG